MLVREKSYSIEEFEQFIAQSENAGRLFELINGEIIEVMPGRTSNSEITYRIAIPLNRFCEEHHIPFHVSGEAGAYQIGEHVLVPDFAYKRTPMSKEYPDPVPPEFAVEVISPTDKATEIREKRQIYRQAGIMLWEIYPQSQSIDVYLPGQPLRTVAIDGTLDGGEVLPGFTLEVKRLFAS